MWKYLEIVLTKTFIFSKTLFQYPLRKTQPIGKTRSVKMPTRFEVYLKKHIIPAGPYCQNYHRVWRDVKYQCLRVFVHTCMCDAAFWLHAEQ